MHDVVLADLVSPEHQQIIVNAIRKIGVSGGSTPIKNVCPSDITYDEIRLMMTRILEEK